MMEADLPWAPREAFVKPSSVGEPVSGEVPRRLETAEPEAIAALKLRNAVRCSGENSGALVSRESAAMVAERAATERGEEASTCSGEEDRSASVESADMAAAIGEAVDPRLPGDPDPNPLRGEALAMEDARETRSAELERGLKASAWAEWPRGDSTMARVAL
jgi:hypothetical protein